MAGHCGFARTGWFRACPRAGFLAPALIHINARTMSTS
jgi:hypothetical protein